MELHSVVPPESVENVIPIAPKCYRTWKGRSSKTTAICTYVTWGWVEMHDVNFLELQKKLQQKWRKDIVTETKNLFWTKT